MSYEPPPPPQPPQQPPGPPSYNPPPGGGYGAPPPGGGYGAPPPAPGGYGGGGMQQPYSVGDAFSYAWGKFQQNMGQMIIAALAIFAGAIVLGIIALVAIIIPANNTDLECVSRDAYGYCNEYDTGGLGFVALIILLLLYVVFFIYAQVIGAGLIRASLNVTNGLPFRTADVFKFDNLGPVIVTSLLVGVGTFIGTLLCIIPGIIFGFLSMYSLFFVIDRNLSPVDAIKASIDMTRNNLGPAILWYLLAYVVILVGTILCYVGLLAAIPIALVGTAYTYKKLNGAPVAP